VELGAIHWEGAMLQYISITVGIMVRVWSMLLSKGKGCVVKMEVSRTRDDTRHTSEDRTLHNHHCENLKSYRLSSVFTPPHA
jgi:hypothetical protein